MKDRIEYILKHYVWVQNLYKYIMSLIFRIVGLFLKTDKDLVLFNSLSGKPFLDSPGAIFRYLKSHPQYSHLKCVWAFRDPSEVQLDGCRIIKIDSWEYFKTALKAKYWITNVNIERGLTFKKKGTKYLNTWHGVSFNTVGNGVPGRHDYNCLNVDFYCYESDYHKAIIMRDFVVREESMLPSGLPRNDELYTVTPEEILGLKKKLGLPEDKKLILYAPTWRDSEDMGKDYVLAPPIDFKKWEKELGNEYIVLLRTHHFTTKLMNVEFNSFVRDFSNHPRINDLFKVSDLIISDYSACIADFSILERPVVCFAYDLEEYSKKRGLYVDLDKVMPSGVKHTEDEVLEHIKSMNYAEECEKTRKLKNEVTYIGGNATQICVEAMFGK